MLSDYSAFDDRTMEDRHDFIQWMFPLDSPSAFNPDAPLLTDEDRAAFHCDKVLQESMRRSLDRFLAFLGLEIGSDATTRRGVNFQKRVAVWNNPNHNWLRITRMLKSLRFSDSRARPPGFGTA